MSDNRQTQPAVTSPTDLLLKTTTRGRHYSSDCFLQSKRGNMERDHMRRNAKNKHKKKKMAIKI